MGKRALCVGINDYPYDRADLNGCVNDAKAWADLLANYYCFNRMDDVKLMLDSDATKANVMKSLRYLVAGAKSGDVLVFTNSSHGTYIVEKSNDEETYREAFCPYDCTDNLINIDEVLENSENLGKGITFTMILDAGFSGAVTRGAASELIPGMKTPDDRRVRFLSPTMDLMGRDDVLVNPWKTMPKRNLQSFVNAIVLLATSPQQYAYDARFHGVYHGAMTYFALQAIREANYKLTYAQLQKRLLYLLNKAGYPQRPCLEGKAADKKREIFR